MKKDYLFESQEADRKRLEQYWKDQANRVESVVENLYRSRRSLVCGRGQEKWRR